MNIYRLTIAIILFYLFIPFTSEAQNIDSLKQITQDNTVADTVRVKAYIQIAQIYDKERKISLAQSYCHQLKAFSQKINYAKGEASAYRNLAVCHYRMEKYSDSTFFYMKLAIKTAKPLEDRSLSSNLYNTLGAFYLQKKQYSEALEACFNALELANKKSKPDIYNHIGIIFKEKKEYKKAIEWLSRGIPALEVANNEESLARAYNNIGNVYRAINKLDSSLIYLEAALEIKKATNDIDGQIISYTNIATAYIVKEDYDTALKYAQNAYEKALSNGSKFSQAQALLSLTQISIRQERYTRAVEYAEQCLDIEWEEIREDALFLLRIAHAELGNYKAAYEYFLEEKELRDSLFNIETEEKIQEIATKYELNESKAKQQAQADSLQQNRRVIIMISILSLLLVGVAVGFFRLYRQRRELAQQLQSQNEELAQKNEELNQLDKTKTRFFSNISHELKTPLTLIINPIRQFLKKANLSNQDFYLLKSAETNSIQLFDLTNQILELTKFDVQKVDVNETAFNFHQLLSKTHADFESLAVAKKIDFQLDFQGSQDLTIFSDSYKIYTILKNLISNAIKFSSEDDTILIKSIEHENELTINISDTGQGIHESDLPNIFDRYYQAKISKKFVGGGTGIGLSLSQEYAKLLGGSISAKSEYLKGSQFTLVLPKKVAQKTITANTFLKEKQTPQLVIPTKNTDNNTANTQPTILLVEDNLSMQSYLKLILSDNFNVIIANHGKEALAILEERVTDIQLIISDIMMPVMNGHELLSALKANPTYAAIPIVMLTALSDTDDKLKALRVGIDDYLVKPFVDEELLARIDNLISNSEQRKAYRQSLISETTEEPTTEQATNSVQELSQKDTDFLKSLEEVVLLNYHNTNFDVSSLALSLRLSRAQVYRRIKSATGLTPKQYIDQVRFQESKKLLEKNQHYTIKAIALSVGFKDEKNFARNFKKRFGKNPSEYLM